MDPLDKILRPLTSDEEDVQLADGIRFFNEGKYVQAIRVLMSLVGGLPLSSRGPEARAHKHLGWCYEATGEILRGYREFQLALECFPPEELVSDGQRARKEVYEIALRTYEEEHPEVLTR